jgi:hypothetical protein
VPATCAGPDAGFPLPYATSRWRSGTSSLRLFDESLASLTRQSTCLASAWRRDDSSSLEGKPHQVRLSQPLNIVRSGTGTPVRGEHGQLTVSRRTPHQEGTPRWDPRVPQAASDLARCVLVYPPGQMLHLDHQRGECPVVAGRLR